MSLDGAIAAITAKYNSMLNTYTLNLKIAINKINLTRVPAFVKVSRINALKIDFAKNCQILQQQYLQKLQQLQKPAPTPLPPNPLPSIKKSALLIASNYTNTPYTLTGCLNDIQFLETMLKTNYAFTDFTLLTDETKSKPTKANILSSIETFLKNSNAGDSLFLGFSGHGSTVLDKNNDESDGLDEAIVSCDLQLALDDELRSLLNTHLKPNTELLCVFDSCHSGSVLDLKYEYMGSSDYNSCNINGQTKDTQGKVILISGCKDSQTSADAVINKVSRGAMIWSLMETLNKTKNPSYLTLLTEMRENLKKSGFTQIPQLSSGQWLDINSKIFV